LGECTRCGACVRVCIAARQGLATGASVLERSDRFTCAGCWKCVEACPEGVDIYGLMMQSRRYRELPESYKAAVRRIQSTGYAMPAEGVNAIREMYGLRPIRRVRRRVLEILLRASEPER